MGLFRETHYMAGRNAEGSAKSDFRVDNKCRENNSQLREPVEHNENVKLK